MSFFGTKKTENPSSSDQAVASDVLSQVRIMGEKSAVSTATNSTVPAGLPTGIEQSTNPTSNPFLHKENAPQPGTPTTPLGTGAETPSKPASPVLPVSPIGTFPNTITLNTTPQKEKHEHASKILIIGSILAVSLILIMGIFLYLEKIKDAEIVDQPQIEESATIEAPAETTTEPTLETEAFSTTRSNYFPLDPETATRESILTEIGALESRILEAGITEPIVFQVTDQNNIPLAMSRFAYLMEFKSGEDILSALDEDFTLVLYLESGQIRRGLATKFKEEQVNPATLLTKLEGVLPAVFQPLLYPNDLVLPTSIKFSSGSYNNSIVRYSNIAPEKGYSFDYILQDKLLFLGNAKDVTRKTLEVGVR